MKILHTADWHIGKIVNDYSMLEDQRYILKQFFQVVEEEQPDVVIIAGDVYDRSVPPKEAVELLDEALTRLSVVFQIPTLVISGNHDSSERLNFGKHLFAMGNLYMEGKFDENLAIKKVTLQDAFGPVNFYLLPYISPTYARFIYQNDGLTDHHQMMAYIMENLDVNQNERNILINHNFFSSFNEEALISDSERDLSIGGTEVIDAELVKHFDYVALGHLHRPQKIKYDHIRYSGSLLKYSASEINTPKGINIINIQEKNKIEITFKNLVPLRDFIKLTGKLEELTSKYFYQQLNQEDYIVAVLTDEGDLYDPLSQLRAIYPNIMQIERPQLSIGTNEEYSKREELHHKTPLEIFQEFYYHITKEELEESYEVKVKEIMDNLHERGDDE
jgi:DNA repair protein SbcD/Mre11